MQQRFNRLLDRRITESEAKILVEMTSIFAEKLFELVDAILDSDVRDHQEDIIADIWAAGIILGTSELLESYKK